MKILLITLLLLCSAVCWGEDKIFLGDITDLGTMEYRKHQEERLNKIEDSLGKIYSMVADLEVKFMGQARYNEIYDPTNKGEVAKQKRWEKEETQELADEINAHIKSGKPIELKFNPTKE